MGDVGTHAIGESLRIKSKKHQRVTATVYGKSSLSLANVRAVLSPAWTQERRRARKVQGAFRLDKIKIYQKYQNLRKT